MPRPLHVKDEPLRRRGEAIAFVVWRGVRQKQGVEASWVIRCARRQTLHPLAGALDPTAFVGIAVAINRRVHIDEDEVGQVVRRLPQRANEEAAERSAVAFA